MILTQTHTHVVTKQGEHLILWNRLTKRTMASYSVYQHFGGKLYGRHDRRSSLYSKEGLAVVAKVVAQQLLWGVEGGTAPSGEAEFMDQALEEYRKGVMPQSTVWEDEAIGEYESTHPFLF